MSRNRFLSVPHSRMLECVCIDDACPMDAVYAQHCHRLVEVCDRFLTNKTLLENLR